MGFFGSGKKEKKENVSELKNGRQAFDAIVDMLKIVRENAFEVEDMPLEMVKDKLDAWLQHVSLLNDHPNGEASFNPQFDGQRDWSGLRKFWADHRKKEYEAISGSLSLFQGFAMNVISQVTTAAIEDKEDDRSLMEQMKSLNSLTNCESIDEIHATVKSSIGNIQKVMKERNERNNKRMSAMGKQLNEVTQKLDAAESALNMDALTGVHSRTAYEEKLKYLAEVNLLCPRDSYLLMVDIDKFKDVNDTHGHQAGDDILVKVAESLIRAFMGRGDMVARYGGDEFCVLLPDSNEQRAKSAAESALKRVRGLTFPDISDELSISLSLGIAKIQGSDSVESWVKRADDALYQSKENGRDQITLAGSETA